jgi:hypothetical protein
VTDDELTAARVEWEKPIRAIHTYADRDAAGPVCAECLRDWPCPTIRALAEFHEPEPRCAHGREEEFDDGTAQCLDCGELLA